MRKQYVQILFSILLIAQPMFAAELSILEWKVGAGENVDAMLLPNKKGLEQLPAISNAILANDNAKVQSMINLQALSVSKKALVNDIGSSPYKVAPLHYAAAKGNVACIQTLLAAGANPNAQDASGCTPLMWAIAKEQEKAVTALLAASDLTVRDNLGRTVLHWAVSKSNSNITTQLLSKGLSVRAKDSQGNTPLHYAMSIKYRFSKAEVQTDPGAAMSGKFMQALAIAAAGAPLTAQATTIMNKTVNAGIATPVAAVANYAGDKSGATIYTSAGGTSVQSINLPAVDTATPLTSGTSAPSSSAGQGISITPPPSTTGTQSTQTSSTGGTQDNLSQSMANFYLALSKMSEAQFTQFQNELNNMSISPTGELIVSPTTPSLAQVTSGGNGAKKAEKPVAASTTKSNIAQGGAVALVDGVLLAGITKMVKEEVLAEMKKGVMNAVKKQLTDGMNAARDALRTEATNASSAAAAITEQEPAKPGIISTALSNVATRVWNEVLPKELTVPAEEAYQFLREPIKDAMKLAGEQVIPGTETTFGAAGTTVSQVLGTTVGDVTGIGVEAVAASAEAAALGTEVGFATSLAASFSTLPVIDVIVVLSVAIQLAVTYGIQAQKKTDLRDRRKEIEKKRGDIIAVLFRHDTSTVTNNKNPVISDYPSYATPNNQGRLPSHFAALSGNSGPQEELNSLMKNTDLLALVDYAGYTPLMYAIMHGREDVIAPSGGSNVLLMQGLTTNKHAMGTSIGIGSFVNPTNITPLKTSLMFGAGKIFDRVFNIVYASDVYTDIEGKTILHYAALNGNKIEQVYNAYAHIPWYTCLVNSASMQTGAYRKMDPKENPLVTAQDMYGATPIHYAAATAAKGLKFLLQKAGKIDLTSLKDKNGMTPLHYAAMCGRSESIKELMNHVDKDKQKEFGAIASNAQNDTYGNPIIPALAGKTAIQLAAHAGFPAVVTLLAHLTGETKKTVGKETMTALHEEAKQAKHANIATKKYQTKIAPKATGRVTKWQAQAEKEQVIALDPLIQAAKDDRPNVVTMMLQQGHDVMVQEPKTGRTALMYAVGVGHKKMVQDILAAATTQGKKDALIAVTDAQGATVINYTKNNAILNMLGTSKAGMQNVPVEKLNKKKKM